MIGDFRSPYKYRFTIHASLMKANELGKPFFQYDKLEQAIQANIQAGKRGVREVFGQISMPAIVSDSQYSGLEYFDCALIPGNIGWFHTDAHQITRYYSKSRKTKDIINLDVVDFFAIEMELTKKEAIVWLREKFAFQNSQEDEAERARLNELLEQGIHMEQVHGEVFQRALFPHLSFSFGPSRIFTLPPSNRAGWYVPVFLFFYRLFEPSLFRPNGRCGQPRDVRGLHQLHGDSWVCEEIRAEKRLQSGCHECSSHYRIQDICRKIRIRREV